MNFINKVINRRDGLSPKVKDILDRKGEATITSMKVGRTPIPSAIQGILSMWSSVPYDKLFHLFIVMETSKGKLVIEKNEVINMEVEKNINRPTAEYMDVKKCPNLTVDQFVENTKKQMGNKFIPYSAYGNNCQDFVYNALTANGIRDRNLLDFVKQETKSIFEGHPNLRKLANTSTNLAGSFNVLLQGGGVHSNQLTNLDIDELMRRYKIPYHGCYVKDRLPHTLQNGAYIINLNGHSHWTALIKSGPHYYYFDAFGFPAPEEVNEIVGDYCWSDKDIQAMSSSSCGWYCVAFIRYMEKKKNKKLAYTNFLKQFESSHLKDNEIILGGLL